MKKISLAMCLTFFQLTTWAQMNPESIVQQNLEAYNQRDIEKFMSYIHPDIQMFEWDTLTPSASGYQEVKSRYAQLFKKSPSLHSLIMSRSVLGNKIIDYEVISGRMGEPNFVEMVVIYEVENQLIKKILVIRK